MPIHQSETTDETTPMRNAVVVAWRHVSDRCHAAWTSHNSGAGMINTTAVAFTAPIVATIRAIAAGSRHLMSRSLQAFPGVGNAPAAPARIVSPTIHPSAAQGSRSNDVRETYARTNGDSW